MVHSQHSVAEARAAEQEVALIAAEELRIKRRARKPKHALSHFLLTTSYKDQLTAAIGLLVWSMYGDQMGSVTDKKNDTTVTLGR